MWTEERVADLKARWLAGQSAKTIGDALGIPRGAVCGKVFRLRTAGELPKAELREPVPKAEEPSRRKRAMFSDVPIEPTEWIPPPGMPPHELSSPIPFAELDDAHCKFPIGDGRDLDALRFCGGPRMEYQRKYSKVLLPYCINCARIAYTI